MENDASCCGQSCGSTITTNKKWLKIAFSLVAFTIFYNVSEAIVSVLIGEKAESVALIGFGFDSLIEVSAAGMMLWRLIEQVRHQSDNAVERAETTVHRFVGVTFFLLSVYIVIHSFLALFHHEKPHASFAGIILAVLSLIIMPLLAWGKMRAAVAINSLALKAEAKETVVCSVLSFILLFGLAANALFGWWWADPISALMMLPWLIKEGLAGIKGESCCG